LFGVVFIFIWGAVVYLCVCFKVLHSSVSLTLLQVYYNSSDKYVLHNAPEVNALCMLGLWLW